MEKKQKIQAVGGLLKILFIFLFAVVLVLSLTDPGNPVLFFVGRVTAILLILDFIAYVVCLSLLRSGKERIKPPALALVIILGFTAPLIALQIPFNRFDEDLVIVFATLAGPIVGLICAVKLFKMSDEKKEEPVVYDEQYALRFMEERAANDMPLSELVELFEAMCQIPLKNELEKMLLFEPGAGNDAEYVLHLARQTNTPDEEYHQISMKIVFDRDDAAGKLSTMKRMPAWSFEMKEDFFAYVRSSEQYRLLESAKPQKVELLVENT